MRHRCAELLFAFWNTSLAHYFTVTFRQRWADFHVFKSPLPPLDPMLVPSRPRSFRCVWIVFFFPTLHHLLILPLEILKGAQDTSRLMIDSASG